MGKADFDLYIISNRKLVPSLPEVFEEIAAFLPRGTVAFQIREKDLNARDLFSLVKEIKRRVDPFATKVFVNDRIDIARASHIEGVHLRNTSILARKASLLVSSVGASTHSLSEITQATLADFATFGPIYSTPSKAKYGPPLGEDTLLEVAKKTSLPLYALGGVCQEHILPLIQKGAFGIAVISAVLADPYPAKKARALLDQLQAARQQCDSI